MSSLRIKRICDCTVLGSDLRPKEVVMIRDFVKFKSDEKIESLYLDNDEFDRGFYIPGNIIVGLTNYQIFKIENAALSSALIKDIKSLYHEKNSIFKWDKIVVRLKDGRTETFGIYYEKTCAYFANHLRTLVTASNITVDVGSNTQLQERQNNKIGTQPLISHNPSQSPSNNNVVAQDSIYAESNKKVDAITTNQIVIAKNQTPISPTIASEELVSSMSVMTISPHQGSYIYVLLLHSESDLKYYIGRTKHPNVRIDNHFSQKGSAWTQLYKPIRVVSVIPSVDEFDEEKTTKQYMMNCGIHRVRGGPYVSKDLRDQEIQSLLKGFLGQKDMCYRCGRKGHFANQCYAKTWICFYCPSTYNPHTNSHCGNCGLINPNFRLRSIEYQNTQVSSDSEDEKCSIM